MLLTSVIHIAIKLISVSSVEATSGRDIKLINDYILMLTQCLSGIVVLLLPGIIQRKLKITIPPGMLAAFAIFMFCGVYLGEVHYFYYRVPHWDTLLHTFSGFALAAVGVSIVGLLNKSTTAPVSLSPGFVAIFAFCFAVAAGTVWEIYEYAVDTIANLNMQKYLLESGEALVGQAALADTMKDIIVDSLGAMVFSVISYVSMKRKEGWIEVMQIKRNPPIVAPVPVYAIVEANDSTEQTQSAITVAEMSSIV